LAQAIPGFILYKTAEALSPNTLRSYQDHLKLWLQYAGDVAVERVRSADLCAFLAWLHSEYQPQRITGKTAPLAAKTLRNYWVSPLGTPSGEAAGQGVSRFSPGPPMSLTLKFRPKFGVVHAIAVGRISGENRPSHSDF
jgi:hypothetical protein